MNKRVRHKWDKAPKTRAKESSSVQFINCGMIRQYVGGIATYFLNDTVIDKIAPPCNKSFMIKNNLK